MSCKHPKQPDPFNYGPRGRHELPCAWPECTPLNRIGVTERPPTIPVTFGHVAPPTIRQSPTLHMLTRKRGSYPIFASALPTVHENGCPRDPCRCSLWFWLAGDEAEQALCGEAFDLPRRVRQLEVELVKRDEVEEQQRGDEVRRRLRALMRELSIWVKHAEGCNRVTGRNGGGCSCSLEYAIANHGLDDIFDWVRPNPPKRGPSLLPLAVAHQLAGEEIPNRLIDEVAALLGVGVGARQPRSGLPGVTWRLNGGQSVDGSPGLEARDGSADDQHDGGADEPGVDDE